MDARTLVSLLKLFPMLLLLLAAVLSYGQSRELANPDFPEADGIPPSAVVELPEQLRGQVVEYRFAQPAGLIRLQVGDQVWTINLPSAVELRRLGWTSESLFPGELIEADIEPSTTEPLVAELGRLQRANGEQLVVRAQQQELSGFSQVPAGFYQLDRDHAHMILSYDHLGFARGRFKFDRLRGSVLWNQENPEQSIVQLEIEASSLSSGVAELDEILRGEAFFDTLNHPKIQFKSTGLQITGWGRARLPGRLTIKGQSRPVEIEASVNRIGENPFNQKITVGLYATSSLNRSAWGLTDYLPTIADRIEMEFDGEFNLRSAESASER